MPPKEKVSKAMVQDMAFKMTKEYGFAAVTARKLAEQLGCSTQPIFRAYENMEELRCDIFYRSAEYFVDYMLSKKSRKDPPYMVLGLAYIELATKEKNLFALIASVDDFGSDPIKESIIKQEAFFSEDKMPELKNMSDKEKQNLFTCVWMFTHGVATMVASNRISLSDKEIKALITKAYQGFLKAQ